ncbi:MAG: tRNA pseudouridine(38-40) synthase TruA [Demequina sp.]
MAYDGTAYHGWAEQPGLPTIQQALHEALARVLRTDAKVRVVAAGRTDAGVHARGQVAHVDVPRDAWEVVPGRSGLAPAQSLRERLDGVLPDDIVIHACDEAPDGFDARFSAVERRYVYRISDSPRTRDPLQRRHVLWHPRGVDVEALARASATLTGLRDFSPFCRAREGATTVRDLLEFHWERQVTGADAGLVTATVRADAFCHSMVRSLVGAVLAVGEGRRDMAWLARVAAYDGRSPAVKVAAAHGLTLEGVTYPPDDLLARRAASTRARRTLD